MIRKILALSTIAICATALQAAAEDDQTFGLEGGASTMGAYISPKMSLSDTWQLRVPLYLGSISDTFDIDGNDLRGKLSANSIGFMLDHKVGGGNFRLSAGVTAGGYRLEGSATNLTVEGNTYPGDFTAIIKQKNQMAPVVAMGWAGDLSPGWGLLAEAGMRLSSLELATTGQENLDPAQRAAFEADVARTNRDLRDIKVIPFATLGVTYRF